MELPKRKNTRLPEYDYSTPGAYFITICTKDRRCILSAIVGDDDLGVPQNRLTKTGKIVEKYIISIDRSQITTVDKYVIMPNHIHLILMINEKSVGADDHGCPSGIVGFDAPRSQQMPKAENPPIEDGFSDGAPRSSPPTNGVVPRIVAAFKRYVNKEIGENIFQRSYHDHIIRNEKDYLRIWEYMENNPKQWELDSLYVRDQECI